MGEWKVIRACARAAMLTNRNGTHEKFCRVRVPRISMFPTVAVMEDRAMGREVGLQSSQNCFQGSSPSCTSMKVPPDTSLRLPTVMARFERASLIPPPHSMV